MSSISGVASSVNVADLAGAIRELDRISDSQISETKPEDRARIAEQLRALGLPQQADRFVPAGKAATTSRAPVSSTGPATAGPRATYSQQGAEAGVSFAHLERNMVVTLPDGSSIGGKELSDSLEKSFSSKEAGKKEVTEKFMRDNGIVRRGKADFVLDESKVTVGSVRESAPASSSGFSWKTAAGVAAGAAMMTGPVGLMLGLPVVAGLFLSNKVKQLVSGAPGLGGIGGALGVGPLGVGGAALGIGGLGSVAGAVRSSSATAIVGAGGASALQAGAGLTGLQSMGRTASMLGMSTDGLEFKMRAQMKAIAADQGDNQMLSMLDNKNMPIEDLIFYFLAYVCEKFDDKLRSKMEEQLMQEKVDRRIEANKQEGANIKSQGKVLGGLVSLIPGVGTIAGAAISQGVDMAIDKGVAAKNEVDSALNGTGKSSTMLANEVQVLTNKWKQMTEMLSNIIKTLHEMAMTPIRNIRS